MIELRIIFEHLEYRHEILSSKINQLTKDMYLRKNIG